MSIHENTEQVVKRLDGEHAKIVSWTHKVMVELSKRTQRFDVA